jgi:hypothetical protein
MIRRVEIVTSVSAQMPFRVPLSALVFTVVLAAGAMNTAIAQNSAATPSEADLKKRCQQLVSFYDRYGASRSENSDGARNHTRIGASIDCANGHAAEGVAAMEDLLRRKKFDVPPSPAGVAESPSR